MIIAKLGLVQMPRTCASAPWEQIRLATGSHKLCSGKQVPGHFDWTAFYLPVVSQFPFY